MSKADELLRELMESVNGETLGVENTVRFLNAHQAARAYLNEKPHEPDNGFRMALNIRPLPASPPHAAAEPEKPMDEATGNPYWLIERGSPAEWFVSCHGKGGDVWTADSSKAAHFTEWGAKQHAKKLEQPPFNIKGPLRATEHIDCAGPAAEPEKPVAWYMPIGGRHSIIEWGAKRPDRVGVVEWHPLYASPSAQPIAREKWRHLKKGDVYEILSPNARWERFPDQRFVVYRGADDWIREIVEFHDGRFERVDDAALKSAGKDDPHG